MNPIYGTAEFVRHRPKYHQATELTRMILPYIDITYVIEGEIHYELNDEPITVKSGEAIVFPPGSARYRPQGKTFSRYDSFNVILPDNFQVPIKGVIKNAFSSDTLYMIEAIKKACQSTSPNKMDKCLSIFLYLYYQLVEIACDNETNPHVKNIKQYISDHLFEPITLDMIAAETHLVDRYICSLFKKHTGMSIIEYINSEKIDLAKRLLTANNIPLYQVAEECGFANYNYFTQVFKKFTGVTAGTYRRNRLNTFSIDNGRPKP